MIGEFGEFKIDGNVLPYSSFAPKLYNWCKALGFQAENILPSRAFCSDESQGYPTIMLTKHFGSYPFNHGQVGGVVDNNRHVAYAHHGDHLVIVHASHVGFEPDDGNFGIYRRMHTPDHRHSSTCGKVCAVLHWYQERYSSAQMSIKIGLIDDTPAVVIEDRYLDPHRAEGLFLKFDQMVDVNENGAPLFLKQLDRAKAFPAARALIDQLGDDAFANDLVPVGRHLKAEMFDFHRHTDLSSTDWDTIEHNLKDVMPQVVTARWPALEAARFNVQMEFDRTYRSIRTEPEFIGKNLLFISGLNIDISPDHTQPFPLTQFAPWAAYIRMRDGTERVIRQDELLEILHNQPTDNPAQMELDAEIKAMIEIDCVNLPKID